jgi:hypothetical protein
MLERVCAANAGAVGIAISRRGYPPVSLERPANATEAVGCASVTGHGHSSARRRERHDARTTSSADPGDSDPSELVLQQLIALQGIRVRATLASFTGAGAIDSRLAGFSGVLSAGVEDGEAIELRLAPGGALRIALDRLEYAVVNPDGFAYRVDGCLVIVDVLAVRGSEPRGGAA